MDADIKGSLAIINRSYRFFTHRGKQMTKEQVKRILEYGLNMGYKSTSELSDSEIDELLTPVSENKNYGKV